jgi:hypothetical protein
LSKSEPEEAITRRAVAREKTLGCCVVVWEPSIHDLV